MSKRPSEESPRGEREPAAAAAPAAEARPVAGETWDPLASVRKSISPTQRIQLLQMQVPVLPPEDFMDTAEFLRGRAMRARRFLPLVLGLAAAFVILLVVGLWSRFSSSRDEHTRSELDTGRPRSAALSSAVPSPAAPHLPAQASPAQPPPSPRKEQPISPKATVTPPTGLVPTKPLTPKPRTDTHSATAAPQPKILTSPTPEPAPSGIKFWTQPR